jgi:Big-like domain-containing protein
MLLRIKLLFAFLSIFILSACGGSESSVPSTPSTAPVAAIDNVSTTQNQVISISVLSNDSDPKNTQLSLLSVSTPANGQASITESLINYTPKDGFSGTETLTYEISNAGGEKATGTVKITVDNVLPIAVNDVKTTDQNQSIEITPLENDSDVVGDQLSLVSASGAVYGAININENTIVYDPIDGYVGTDSFSYIITDLYGGTNEAIITININNLAPEVVDDETKVFKNSDVTIDVLANDGDVIGDFLTLQSFSVPKHGSANIVDNKINYQPEAEYVGNDIFSYTAIDNHGGATSGFIRVTINNGVNIAGKLIDFSQARQEVVINVAGVEYNGLTDETGNFSIAIDANNTGAMVIASAENVATNYSLKAHIGDVASLLATMDENFTVNINLSNISTAEYELINVMSENAINNMSELVAAQLLVKSDLVLKLAASAELIYQENTISLPSSYTSINKFMQAPFEVDKQLAIWRSNNVVDYYNVLDNILTNSQLSSLTNDLSEGSNILLQDNNSGISYRSTNLQLNSGATGYYLDSSSEKTVLSWEKNSNEVIVDFNNSAKKIISSQGMYCQGNVTDSVNFSVNSMKIHPLYSTKGYDVYIAKLAGTFSNSTCFDVNIHQYEYITFKVAKLKPFVINAGSYAFGGFIQSADTTTISYDSIASNFTFAENGSFSEIIDMPLASIKSRAGQWQNINNQLTLTYDNGLIVHYDKAANYQGNNILNAYIKSNTEIIATRQTLIVEKHAVSFQITDGYLRWQKLPLFDQNIDVGFGFTFNNDGNGIQQNLLLGEYQDSFSGVFSWQFTQNHFSLNYYLLNGNEYVNYCDVNTANCQQWRQRDMELIGATDNGFIFKVYQELWNNDQPQIAGYIAIFQQFPL